MQIPLNWIKRHWLKIAGLMIIVGVATLFARTRVCPICHLGILMTPESVAARGATEPSKNLAIWNGSYHGPDYEDYSKICTRCWMAYHAKLGVWERASEVADAFHRPLLPKIRQVPLPAAEHVHYRVVYTQYYSGGQISEAVRFWCDDLPNVIEPLRAYAVAHNLFFGIDEPPRLEGEQFVRIETDPRTI